MALVGYVDESGFHTNAPVFVLSAYIAEADVWKQFTDEWQRTLQMQPALAYFKMAEAFKLRKQFSGWLPERRDERLRLLYAIIEQHVQAIASCVMRHEDYRKAVDILPARMGKAVHPYVFMFSAIVSNVARYQKQMGLKGKVDFIFDRQVMYETKLLAEWNWLVEHATDDTKPLLGQPPTFRDEVVFLPLQAADLEAWWLRRRWEEKLLGLPRYEYPWQQQRMIPELEAEFTEQQMRAGFQERLLNFGYRLTMAIGPRSWQF